MNITPLSILKSAFLLLIVLCHDGNAQDFVTIGEINVTGNQRTHTRIIQRELPFREGDSIRKSELATVLEQSRRNMFNTRLFIWVRADTLNAGDNRVNVQIEVKERWYFLAVPMVFLADRNVNEWWYDRGRDLSRITYGAIAKHYNLTGNNDQLKLKAYGGFIPYFELTYGRPYIDRRQRMGISGGVFYSTQRTMPFRTWNDKLDFYATEKRMRSRTGVFLQYGLRNSLYHFHSLYAGYSAGRIADTISVLNPDYFGPGRTRQQILTLSYDYRYDTRDNRQYPLEGKIYFGQLTHYRIYGAEKTGQTSLIAGGGVYFRIKGKWYGDALLRAKWSSPTRQFYPLVSGLGFNNNLIRGYELYVIDGQHSTLLRTNLKYQLLKHTFDLRKFIRIKQFNSLPVAVYPTIYWDAGYVRNYFPELSNTRLGNRALNGGGAGLDVVTWYDSLIRINYSVNQMNERRLYFGLYRDF